MNPRKFLVFIKSPSFLSRLVLLAILEVLLFGPAFFQTKLDRGQKSFDQYWQETGLTSRELDAVLAPQSCLADHRHFLGCVNAISAIAERYNLIFESNGQLHPMNPDSIEKRLTEKKELKSWEEKLGVEEFSPDFSFSEVWKELDRKWVKPEERSAVVALGINAFLSVTRDPHSYILPLNLYEEVLSRSDARPMHLGFVSKRVKGGAFIRKVFEGSPADKAGLRKGDRILEVNDQLITSLHPTQFNEMLKVRTGDRIRLLVERTQAKGTLRKYVEILKSDDIYPNVLSKMLEGQSRVGLLTIHKFSRETCQMAKNHLISLQEEGARGLILDLRDNPGGQVDEAACILNLFLEPGQVLFETRYLDPTRQIDRYRSTKPVVYRGAIAVLINGGSASASEIVAGVLKDLGRATLVGERSFGKGTFQDGRIWASNPLIAYFETEGFYYFPSGWTPQLVGLEPDIKVGAIEDESFREEDLYYAPMRPTDLWNGPQNLGWLKEPGCASPMLMADADPQIEKAWALMSCDSGSKGHDRHGTL